jgi:hypothetical protein
MEEHYKFMVVQINIKQLYVGGNTHILGYLDMNNQPIATPVTFYDAANITLIIVLIILLLKVMLMVILHKVKFIVAGTSGNINGWIHSLIIMY